MNITNPITTAEEVRFINIIDMATTFTAMIRVFEENSKVKIAEMLKAYFKNKIQNIDDQNDFEQMHKAFCKDFIEEIKTAQRIKNKILVKDSKPATYGQAAKVFDISIKVFVYYCKMPNFETSSEIQRFLHAAIDTPILKYLKKTYPGKKIAAKTIEEIDFNQYCSLQEIVCEEIKNKYDNKIYPVQYDDMLWNSLNR